MTKDQVIMAINDEPEFPGDIPMNVFGAFHKAIINEDVDFFVEAIRSAVRLTKAGIIERINSIQD